MSVHYCNIKTTMNDTPTPRTDACAKNIDQSNFEDSWKDDFEEFAWVTADFARTLERELTAAREEIGNMASENSNLHLELLCVRKQRDRLAEALEITRDRLSFYSPLDDCIDSADEALQSLNKPKPESKDPHRFCRGGGGNNFHCGCKYDG